MKNIPASYRDQPRDSWESTGNRLSYCWFESVIRWLLRKDPDMVLRRSFSSRWSQCSYMPFEEGCSCLSEVKQESYSISSSRFHRFGPWDNITLWTSGRSGPRSHHQGLWSGLVSLFGLGQAFARKLPTPQRCAGHTDPSGTQICLRRLLELRLTEGCVGLLSQDKNGWSWSRGLFPLHGPKSLIFYCLLSSI